MGSDYGAHIPDNTRVQITPVQFFAVLCRHYRDPTSYHSRIMPTGSTYGTEKGKLGLPIAGNTMGCRVS